jgi:adenine phosphoribosyltransferase
MKSKLVEETFLLKLSPDLERELPLITLSGTDKRIASFVMLGDVELNAKCAALLVEQMKSQNLLDRFDILVALEAKGIALTHECASLLNHPYYVVIRKSLKKYMISPISVPVESITSFGEQILVLNGLDVERINGKRVCITEDVIATGGSVRAACKLIEKAGGEVTIIASILLKGEFEDPRLLYYHRPPL